jgi:hypothetical protein
MDSDPSIRRIKVPKPDGFRKFLEQSPHISKEAIRATQALLRAPDQEPEYLPTLKQRGRAAFSKASPLIENAKGQMQEFESGSGADLDRFRVESDRLIDE